jgi:hypothetical protein
MLASSGSQFDEDGTLNNERALKTLTALMDELRGLT